jgi:hypothetical protein
MNASSHIPAVQVIGDKHGRVIGLSGWEEFERWALSSDPQYRHVQYMAKTYDLSECDKYRFYIGYLTKLNAELFAVIAAKGPGPIFIPTPEEK